MRGRRSLVGLIGANIMSSLSAGTRVLTRGGMCVHQAAETFRLFTGVPPDVERMHRTLKEQTSKPPAVKASAT